MSTNKETNTNDDSHSIDMLGYMPCESGYYWIYFDGMKHPCLGYLHADDMDAGSRRVRFITGQEMRDGDLFLRGSKWIEIQKPKDRHGFYKESQTEAGYVLAPRSLLENLLDNTREYRAQNSWWRDEKRSDYQMEYNQLSDEIEKTEMILSKEPVDGGLVVRLRPMDEAPRDGTPIIVKATTQFGDYYYLCKWGKPYSTLEMEAWIYAEGYELSYITEDKAHGWMPEPKDAKL